MECKQITMKYNYTRDTRDLSWNFNLLLNLVSPPESERLIEGFVPSFESLVRLEDRLRDHQRHYKGL